MATPSSYFLPHKASWPIGASIGMTFLLAGFGNYLNGSSVGSPMMVLGAIVVATILFCWFSEVVSESVSGAYNHQVDMSFRWGMVWFIASEVMFFASFFGALYYARVLSVDWLGGIGDPTLAGQTHELLWKSFEAVWPTNGPGHVGGHADGTFEAMGAFGIPLLNTLILLSSGATVTWAHQGLLVNNRDQLIKGLAATVGLGFLFVAFQAYEYHHAYAELGLTMGTGIYGSTFFMLTGFHGMHVTIGAIMLTVVLLRSMRGHFSPKHHFAFEAAAWYWHFVDVVWLGLYIFVYWL
ncbi:MAG: cytochrome c oxidase subunit 3 [Methylococcaceae bacterium]|nr:MAG: cytochrome c oxidase subunit 3 [Methylococcaceae bacterium]